MTVEPLEIGGVVLNLIYTILLIRQNIWCWLFGILGSAISIPLFIEAKLYSEVILYLFYMAVGVYGWIKWHTKDNSILPIVKWSVAKHIMAIGIGIICTYGLGLFWSTQSDAERTFIDAGTTIFSFVASFLEANKVLSSWVYWIVLNGISIWLYHDRGLLFYALLSGLLTVLSVTGFINWKKGFKSQTLHG